MWASPAYFRLSLIPQIAFESAGETWGRKSCDGQSGSIDEFSSNTFENRKLSDHHRQLHALTLPQFPLGSIPPHSVTSYVRFMHSLLAHRKLT